MGLFHAIIFIFALYPSNHSVKVESPTPQLQLRNTTISRNISILNVNVKDSWRLGEAPSYVTEAGDRGPQ